MSSALGIVCAALLRSYDTSAALSRRSILTHRILNTIRCTIDAVVLPYPDHCPAQFLKARVGVSISLSILLDLVGPKVTVRLADRMVLWAPMPEATIDEYCDLPSRKYEICTPSQAFDRRPVNEVPKPPTMQLSP